MASMDGEHAGEGLDELFRRLPAALYRTSPDGEVLAANDAIAELLGFDSADAMVGADGVAEHAHVDPRERSMWRRVMETEGTVRDFVVRLRRQDGEVIWVEDTASTVYDDDGEVLYYEGFLVDVTEQIKASNASAILADVLDTTSDLVVVFDEHRRLRYANDASRRFLGLDPVASDEELAFSEVFPRIRWRRALAAGRRGWSGETTLIDTAGRERPLWVVVDTHAGRDGSMYLSGIGRDLTRMHAAQRRLEELVAAKDAFVATVSHELRNPLAGVVGLAEEMRDRFDEFGEEEQHDLITLISHQAAEMTSLVDDLLVAARSDVGDVAVVPEVVDMAATLATVSAGADIDLEMPEEEVLAWADPQRVRQIIRNLISNAHRHGGENVRATLSTRDDTVMVTVSDDGPGVDPDAVEDIFEPYRRADGSTVKQGSVGIGLSVARQLARLMHGDLQYGHQAGWTEFCLQVPAAQRLRLPAS